MDAGELVLVASAVTVGAVHTLLGVDHTVPILALSRAEGWGLKKSLAVTTCLGLVHLGSAALIFVLASSFAWPLARLVSLEDIRGEWALRGLVLFGFVYGTLALLRLLTGPLGRRVKGTPASRGSLARFVPFGVVLSVLGPCEPLLPLLTAGHGASGFGLPLAIFGAFSVGTLVTMLSVVGLGFVGLQKASGRYPSLDQLTPYSHVLAGYGVCWTALLLI